MRKLALILLAIAALTIIVGASFKPFRNMAIPYLDTSIYISSSSDTMYFVTDENKDTVDWFIYLEGKKLNREECDLLYKLADSLKEE